MSEELKVPEQSAEEFVRMLLWDEFPECCGSPVVGAEYMGQQEMICCGNPEPALLTDAQIVAALRERFPEGAAAASRDAGVQRLREALDRLCEEFVRVFPVYYYAEPWAHDRNEALIAARAALKEQQ